ASGVRGFPRSETNQVDVVAPLAARILVARIRLLLLWSRVTNGASLRNDWVRDKPQRRPPMKKSAIAAMILAASASLAFAESAKPDDNSLSGKEMKDGATVQGGNTDMPKAKPDDHSLSGKEMKDGATLKGGSTDMPNVKPTDGSLVGKEMQD